jgi:hypothetical protein
LWRRRPEAEESSGSDFIATETLGCAMTVHIKLKSVGAIAAMLGLTFCARGADDVGKVCVEKIPSRPSSSWKGNATGATEHSTFTVRIDDLPVIGVTTNSSGVFTNLSLTKKHLVTIRLDDKPLTAFRFSFESRPSHVRLWYNEFYGTWSLSDVRASEKCACSSSTSPNTAGRHEPRPR